MLYAPFTDAFFVKRITRDAYQETGPTSLACLFVFISELGNLSAKWRLNLRRGMIAFATAATHFMRFQC